MQRNKASYPLAGMQVKEIKRRMLNWSSQFSILLFLDNNEFSSPYNKYECLLGAGSMPIDAAEGEGSDWQFIHICYDYKNVLEEKLTSAHPVKLGFPLSNFFIPATVCYIDKEKTSLTIETFGNPQQVFEEISACDSVIQSSEIPRLQFTKGVDKETYLQTIEKLRWHIAEGDCYEINFCNEGYCEHASIHPLSVFEALNELSPAPFAAYYRLEDRYMMSASPERYMQRTGPKILSQPMKGTARREKDAAKDEAAKMELRNSIKEQAENVMITDLVRNDLARCCKPGSVQVEELFGVYTYPTVHQMISTVSGTLKDNISFADAISCTFPMGSMTGAPKYKVMQLIEQYERSRRELFSGTVGYITPEGDFDTNVIIRSLFYNATTQYLCYQTGGAITYDSNPELEWEETRLKAWALERIFQ